MAMEPAALTKGTKVFRFALEDWQRTVHEHPHIYEGEVVGGGDHQVTIKWEGNHNPDRQSRRRAARSLFPTLREALEAALEGLRAMEETARERYLAAGRSIYRAQLWLVQLDAEAAPGGPVTLDKETTT